MRAIWIFHIIDMRASKAQILLKGHWLQDPLYGQLKISSRRGPRENRSTAVIDLRGLCSYAVSSFRDGK